VGEQGDPAARLVQETDPLPDAPNPWGRIERRLELPDRTALGEPKEVHEVLVLVDLPSEEPLLRPRVFGRSPEPVRDDLPPVDGSEGAVDVDRDEGPGGRLGAPGTHERLPIPIRMPPIHSSRIPAAATGRR